MKSTLKFFHLIILYLLCQQDINAQPTPIQRNYQTHFQSWNSLSIRNKINSSFDLEFFTLHWRQRVFENDYNIFRAYQQQAYELYLHYILNENFTFSITPFGYYHEVPLAEDGWYFLREPQYEYRFTFRILNSNEYGRFNMTNRFGFEYRHRTSLQDRGKFWPEHRLLYRIRFAYDLDYHWELIFRNEIFLAFGKYIQYNLFDLNIAFLGIQHKISDHVCVSVGYANFFEPLRSGQDFNISHALNIALSLNNIFPVKNSR